MQSDMFAMLFRMGVTAAMLVVATACAHKPPTDPHLASRIEAFRAFPSTLPACAATLKPQLVDDINPRTLAPHERITIRGTLRLGSLGACTLMACPGSECCNHCGLGEWKLIGRSGTKEITLSQRQGDPDRMDCDGAAAAKALGRPDVTVVAQPNLITPELVGEWPWLLEIDHMCRN